MRKVVTILLVLFLLLVLVVMFLFSKLDTVIRTGIETAGPQVTGTKVKLAGVDVQLFSGKAGFNGLAIGNPKGFTSDDAFKVGKVGVEVDLNTIEQKVVLVKSVVIDRVRVNWEGWNGDNLKAIKEKIQIFARTPAGGKNKTEQKKPRGAEKKIIVRDFMFENSSVTVVVDGREIATIKIPDLHLTEIGRQEGGQSIKEVLNLAYRQIFASLQLVIAQNSAALKAKASELPAKGKDTIRKGGLGQAEEKAAGGL